MVGNSKQPVPLPIVVSREGKWFVASCPLLDIGTQGLSEAEARDNMRELIEDYFKDPDTPKPSIKTLMSATVSVMSVPVELGAGYGKAAAVESG